MRQWLTAHLHLVLGYGYEFMGGVLIFVSSAVTETSMPARQRRKHWIVFGLLAICYIVFGIGIRQEDVHRAELDRHESEGLRKDLSNMLPMIPLMVSLRSDLDVIKTEETRKDTHSPRVTTQLRAADNTSDRLLVAMTPAVVNQIRVGGQEWKEEMDRVDKFTEGVMHTGNAAGKLQGLAFRAEKFADVDKQYQEKLKYVMLMATYLRQAMLDRLPTAQRAEQGAATPDAFQKFVIGDLHYSDLPAAANYLETLANKFNMATPPTNLSGTVR